MNSLDKRIARERKQRYKRLIKLRKARDMSNKYRKRIMKLSAIDKYVGYDKHNEFFLSDLAKAILDNQNRIIGARIRPPKPPSQTI